jgi:hypothetical protein
MVFLLRPVCDIVLQLPVMLRAQVYLEAFPDTDLTVRASEYFVPLSTGLSAI